MITRQIRSSDREQLIALWQSVFGDSVDFIEDFLDNVMLPSRGFVAEVDGKIGSAAYIIDGISVSARPFPYIYAVSTLPEHRGLGMGEAVSLACARQIESEGGTAALHPAEDSLFNWYGKMGFAPSFSACESIIDISSETPIALKQLTPVEYALERRRMLSGNIFADFEPRLLTWLQKMSGGKFYNFDGGCAFAYSFSGTLNVAELLSTHNGRAAMATMSKNADSTRVFVRTPALDSLEQIGEICDFVATAHSDINSAYWGFAFD